MTLNEHTEMVRNLAAALKTTDDLQVIETHISSVILAGDTAYKLKKPVDFGFLDYTTLPRRKTFCEEEVRINRAFAPDLYEGVVTVNGSVGSPAFASEGAVIDFAVKMRRFDQQSRLDEMADAGTLDIALLEKAAERIAALHEKSPRAAPHSEFATPQRVLKPMTENFELLRGAASFQAKIDAVERWTLERSKTLEPMVLSRKKEGFVRECHGDLHLHNMVLMEGEIMLFDAIEFNPFLSHIDVISDLAFLLMDLEYRGLWGHAARVLNRYLEHTGDYEALRLLGFYKVYRAMVRAKVAYLQASQQTSEQARAGTMREVERYVDLAVGYTRAKTPFMAVTHGFSGSGKSTFALMLCERFGAIRIRSDVERRRLFPDGSVYTADATERTYERLRDLAQAVFESGYPAIADATFLKAWQRALFRERFEHFFILTMSCDTALLRQRVGRRLREGTDVSEADSAVLQMQIEGAEPLSENERACAIRVDCSDLEAMRRALDDAERTYPSFSENRVFSRS